MIRYIAHIKPCQETKHKELFVLKVKEDSMDWNFLDAIVLLKQPWHGHRDAWCRTKTIMTREIFEKNKKNGTLNINDEAIHNLY